MTAEPGPGVLVRHGRVALQFDAGRATVMRLAALGIDPAELAAVFVTHHHSDHLAGPTDLVLTRWLGFGDARDTPLPVVAPRGPSATLQTLIPPPAHDDQADVFVAEVRRGGYAGEIVVGHDLLRITLGGRA